MPKILIFGLLLVATLSGCATSGVPYLYKDTQRSNQPAVIILHTSTGIDSGEYEYARFLKSKGFAVAVVDYYSQGGTDNIGKAYDQLISDNKVDPTRIGLVGFSRGAHIAINTSSLANKFESRKYNAIVSFYIGPFVPSNSEHVPPILFLHGDQDVYVQGNRIEQFCDIQKRIYKKVCEYKIFTDTKHSFDKARSKYQGYNVVVTNESYNRSVNFLNQYLK